MPLCFMSRAYRNARHLTGEIPRPTNFTDDTGLELECRGGLAIVHSSPMSLDYAFVLRVSGLQTYSTPGTWTSLTDNIRGCPRCCLSGQLGWIQCWFFRINRLGLQSHQQPSVLLLVG
jgi:hypothetical protein